MIVILKQEVTLQMALSMRNRELASGALVATGLAALLSLLSGGWLPPVAALALYLPIAILLARQLPPNRSMGWANRVTLVRAAAVCALASLLTHPPLFFERPEVVIGLVIVILVLDGVDGWLARRLHQTSRLGARFDMETDAALIIVLCLALWLSGLAPVWVLAIGLMRPLFVVGGWGLPWLRKDLPASFRRKFVCVLQIAVLPAALLPMLHESERLPLLAGTLLALIYSFGVDTAWLYRRRRRKTRTQWRPS
jgi:phosphatidylglycerophosphate synthase